MVNFVNFLQSDEVLLDKSLRETTRIAAMSYLYSSPWGEVAMYELMFLRIPPPFSTTAVLLNQGKNKLHPIWSGTILLKQLRYME